MQGARRHQRTHGHHAPPAKERNRTRGGNEKQALCPVHCGTRAVPASLALHDLGATQTKLQNARRIALTACSRPRCRLGGPSCPANAWHSRLGDAKQNAKQMEEMETCTNVVPIKEEAERAAREEQERRRVRRRRMRRAADGGAKGCSTEGRSISYRKRAFHRSRRLPWSTRPGTAFCRSL